MSRSDIERIEAEIAGLEAKIKERERNRNAPDDLCRAAGVGFRHTDKFVIAHRAQLNALQIELIVLRITGGGWSAADVIRRMSA